MNSEQTERAVIVNGRVVPVDRSGPQNTTPWDLYAAAALQAIVSTSPTDQAAAERAARIADMLLAEKLYRQPPAAASNIAGGLASTIMLPPVDFSDKEKIDFLEWQLRNLERMLNDSRRFNETENTKLRNAVALAAQMFRTYELLHRQKSTDEGNRKAEANAELAKTMENALGAPAGTRPPREWIIVPLADPDGPDTLARLWQPDNADRVAQYRAFSLTEWGAIRVREII